MQHDPHTATPLASSTLCTTASSPLKQTVQTPHSSHTGAFTDSPPSSRGSSTRACAGCPGTTTPSCSSWSGCRPPAARYVGKDCCPMHVVSQGARRLYNHLLKPLLLQHQRDIEDFLSKCKAMMVRRAWSARNTCTAHTERWRVERGDRHHAQHPRQRSFFALRVCRRVQGRQQRPQCTLMNSVVTHLLYCA